MVVARQPEGRYNKIQNKYLIIHSIKSVLKPKVAVYGCPLDT
jgi:hypothetical protein